ncbi:MAG: hypothetical protein A2Y84_01285 [Candidatus Colwellbacteria bacterium RBG_13_48_8]|uniref:UDP-N-acetylmuramate--L-alanine ligase n=1 Tax=Candidatus Colwellbacteria bacterium RBG_13_48_8 TaxID=1797685 RepID=A0A1G1YXS3_9BACT|nr:MAG: hypothetical protein A2Y84_01285 [Candidatus Colwellbacteria bacterium RBG_13_48_8]
MKKIHCIGIGGIGVSALARYYLNQGYAVSGSDLVRSEITQSLLKDGVDIYIGGGKPELINENIEKVIYSPAVGLGHPELVRARDLGLPALSYPEALGEVSKKYFTLAVSGSHGKSTTSSLLALMLVEAGLDPTVIVGTRLKEFGGSNFRPGEGKYLVIEADEWDRAFYNYQPQAAIITNIDEEHLDTYKNLDGVIEGFRRYVNSLPSSAVLVVNYQDGNSRQACHNFRGKIIYFNGKDEKIDWPLKLPGFFNQLNAEAAWQAAKLVGVGRESAEKAVAQYRGAWRRLEPLEKISDSSPKVEYFSDYGHHPTEVKVTLEALRQRYPREKITLVFQPHQARRLTELFPNFVSAFKGADELFLLPVYRVAGREDEGGKSSQDLTKAVVDYNQLNHLTQKVVYCPKLEETLARVKGGVVVFMGAGSIDTEVRRYFRSKLLPTEHQL